MKIIKKSLISAMLFLIYANNAYATTAGTYVAKENTGVNKIVLLFTKNTLYFPYFGKI